MAIEKWDFDLVHSALGAPHVLESARLIRRARPHRDNVSDQWLAIGDSAPGFRPSADGLEDGSRR